ncbi:CarboxypepD_reg-like domain-containing protein [Cyclobacterium lianum]|uniref:CarboxypepD_reg-like domain-containing protein n=1 Tax=Cyclobacterium lianum TaxID=388280 RepID=A0A1M7PKZ2_9BACT|nr:carboxypeptidase-like regulatory domain-containing protein [Cyclobacterium lianum]SHN17900.1 CarboxypepD_reg-like domain-containing protein [Cyclobacterium lianum]
MKMRSFCILGVFLLLLGTTAAFPSEAQRIMVEGRVVDEETDLPLPFVTVFVNNTAGGTVADENGHFELEMDAGHYELVLSLVGYESLIFSADFSDKSPRFLFKMAQRPIDLNELLVDGERSPEWYENLRTFEYHFLGSSQFAASCKILNPEVLIIDFDQKVLKVHSIDFLTIENHALGYRINYLLTSFELDTDKRTFHFSGYPRYSQMEGGKMKQRRWEKNRMTAYQGSWLHFRHSLLKGSLAQEGFEVRRMKLIPNPDRPSDRRILEAKGQLKIVEEMPHSPFRDSLLAIVRKQSLPKTVELVSPDTLQKSAYSQVLDGEGTLQLEFEDFLQITYTKGRLSREFVDSFAPGEAPRSPYPVSLLSQTAPVKIYPTGLEDPALKLFVEGYWSWQRMGDAVPIDFELPE